MKIKKTIFIYQTEDAEPMAFATRKEADEAIQDEINYLVERWHFDEEEVAEAQEELAKCRIDGNYIGTYLGEHNIGYYIQELEFEI
jgi:hypothetical protein